MSPAGVIAGYSGARSALADSARFPPLPSLVPPPGGSHSRSDEETRSLLSLSLLPSSGITYSPKRHEPQLAFIVDVVKSNARARRTIPARRW